MDVLSSVLRELRLESATYRSLRLRAPWRLEFDGGLRGVHVFVRGTGVLSVDGQEPLTLRAGDLVVLPRADSHVMSSPGAPDSPALSTLELARRTQGNEILLGGPGEPTTIMCGAFFFGDEDHPAVAGFPRCIHVPARAGRRTGLVDECDPSLDKGDHRQRRGQRDHHGATVGCARDPGAASPPGNR